MRILCVDDDPAAREIYSLGLKNALPDDYTLVAESGEEALKIMADNPCEVVILDLMMPGMDGLEVLAAVRERYDRTEVIMVTGGPSIETAVEAMQQGARDYLEKPINISLLAEKIENVREYIVRVREADELLMAKETSENSAGREVHELEARLEDMEDAAEKALVILKSDSPEQDRIAAACEILETMIEDF